MAKDEATLTNESLMIAQDQDCMFHSANAGQELLLPSPLSNIIFDFQKKFTLSKHEMLNDGKNTRGLVATNFDMFIQGESEAIIHVKV